MATESGGNTSNLVTDGSTEFPQTTTYADLRDERVESQARQDELVKRDNVIYPRTVL
jgi:hypothetical protein